VPTHVRAGTARIEWGVARDADDNLWANGAPAAECLWEFVRLAGSSDTDNFVRYASRYGVLGLTRDAIPGTADGVRARAIEGEVSWFWEPVEAWRAWAIHAKATLALASALQAGDLIDPFQVLLAVGIDAGEPDDIAFAAEIAQRNAPDFEPGPDETMAYWEMVNSTLSPWWLARFLSDPLEEFGGDTVGTQRQAIAIMLTSLWLEYSRLTPQVQWGDGPPQVTLTSHRSVIVMDVPDRFGWPYGSLFPILASELVAVITDQTPIATCARCRTLRPTQIRVRPDRLVYCTSCRREVELETKRASERKRYQAKKATADSQDDSQAG